MALPNKRKPSSEFDDDISISKNPILVLVFVVVCLFWGYLIGDYITLNNSFTKKLRTALDNAVMSKDHFETTTSNTIITNNNHVSPIL